MKRSYTLWLLLPLMLLMLSAPVRAQAVVEGTVINTATGAGLGGVRIKLSGPHDPIYGKTDAQGHFQFSGIEPGYYSISADAPGFLQPGESGSRAMTVSSLDLRLAAQGGPAPGPGGAPHATVTIPMTQAAVIAGRITQPDGQPCVSCQVDLFQKNSRATSSYNQGLVSQSLVTNDLGEFRASRLIPGEYFVVAAQSQSAAGRQPTFRATYYPASLDFAGSKALNIQAGEEAKADMQILNVRGVRLSGRLVPPNPAVGRSGSRIYTTLALMPELYIPSMHRGVAATVRAERFEIQDVLPGRYTLLAVTRDSDGQPSDIYARAIWGAAQSIVVGEGGLETDVVLQPLHDIRGKITFAPGCETAPLQIGASVTSPMPSPVPAMVTTAADGSFALHGVLPGHIILRIRFSNSYPSFPVTMASKLGDRELTNETFDYPASPEGDLSITVNCRTNGRTK